MLKLSERMYELGIQASQYQPDDFNVITHGDFWVNNMLFRYDASNQPIEHIMVGTYFSISDVFVRYTKRLKAANCKKIANFFYCIAVFFPYYLL